MIKCAKHILKYQNKDKNNLLNQIFVDYQLCLEHYIKLICSDNLPIQKFYSSKILPAYSNIEKSHWKQTCYKHASQIIRSNLDYIKIKTFKRYKKVYHYFSKKGRQLIFLSKKYSELKINYLKRIKINIKDVSIDLNYFNFDIQQGKTFDNFIRIVTPYKKVGGKQYQTIKIPFKEHKHSLKFKDWKLLNTVRLEKQGTKIFLCKIYEKESPSKKSTGDTIGFDCGYNKLLSDSNGNHYGTELKNVYERLSKKKRGSKNYKQLLIYKRNLINQVINEIEFDNIQTVVIEDLKQVKFKSKLTTYFMNKLQYWSYRQVRDKLENLSEIEGFYLVKINPVYTSQTCSSCGTVDKSSRQGEIYHCSICGLLIDSDTNGAINILHRGIYNSSDKEKNLT